VNYSPREPPSEESHAPRHDEQTAGRDDVPLEGKALWEQVWANWVSPEIEVRREMGRLPAGFELRAAQIIFCPDAEVPTVRLNEEVVAVARVKIEGPIAKGQAIFENQIQDVESVDLTDSDPDSGHCTLLRVKDHWHIAFDLRRYATHVGEMVRLSGQFLDTATLALTSGSTEAFVDNLFSAVELLAKAQLVLFGGHDPASRKHSAIHPHFNMWGKLGNTRAEYVRLLNDLAKMRPKARYMEGPLTLSHSDAAAMLAVGRDFQTDMLAQIPSRHHVELP
jgi:HEPN domain-containing protein